MSDRGYPVSKRIGDAERDHAAEFLREHLAQGRLDPAEFDDRLTAALNAKVQSDLDRLFVDLPSPTPRSPGMGIAVPSAPPGRQVGMPKNIRNTIDIVVGVIWPITIAICFIVGWQHWYLIFVPMIITSIWERKKKQDRAEREDLEKQHRQQLGQERPEHEDDQQ